MFASLEDYEEMFGEATTQDELRRAARTVARLTRADVYPVDDEGVPEDEDVFDALVEAQLLQCRHSAQLSEYEHSVASGSVSVGGVSYNVTARTPPGGKGEFSSEARDVLLEAGLMSRVGRYL